MKLTLVDLGSPPRIEVNEPLGLESILGNLYASFGEVVKGNIVLSQISDIKIEELLKSDVIGFSTNIGSYELLNEYMLNLLNHGGVVENLPLILLGGSIATFAAKDLLQQYPFAVCVRGEGESAVRNIVDILLRSEGQYSNILSNQELNQIPNLSFINDIGNLVETKSIIENLDDLAIPSRLFISEIIKYRGIARAETSRGCPFGKCRFCAVASKYGDPLWRPMPIDRVIADFRNISSAGALSVYLSDDDFFGTSLERVNLLCDSIIAEKAQDKINPDLNFFISTRVNSILGEKLGGISKSIETLKKMKQAGFREIFIGIESGSKEQIHRYGKGTTVDKSIQAINLIRSLDMSVDIGFIMFDKFMNISQLQTNIQFLKDANLFSHEANLLKILRIQPRTLLSDDLRAEGIITDDLLDINDLKYPYEFEDPKVGWIYKAYQEWESPMKNLYYNLQAASRGEVPSEEIRSKLKMVLGQLREIDMTFLETIVPISTRFPISSASLDIVSIDLHDKRQRLVTTAKKYLDEYYHL